MERKTDTMNHTFDAVAFTEIIEQLAEYANSPQAKEKIRNLQPYLDEGELKRNMRDTTQARQMLDLLGTPPLPVMEQIGHIVEKAVLGELLLPEEMEEVGMFLAAVLAGFVKMGTHACFEHADKIKLGE